MPLIFQYGSNCDAERLNGKTRLNGDAADRGRAETIDEFNLAFDVWSQTNGCAASDLVLAPGTGRHAWGVLFEVPADLIRGRSRADGRKTMEEIEGPRYEETTIRIRDNAGVEQEAITFTVKADAISQGLYTTAEYVGHIVRGLRSHDVPDEYIQRVIDIATRTNQKAAKASTKENRQIESLRQPDSSR